MQCNVIFTEIGKGRLTVGKIYGGLLILENWKATKFGKTPMMDVVVSTATWSMLSFVPSSSILYTVWAGSLCKRFCNVLSGSSPCLLGQHGSCSTAQRPVELSEKTCYKTFSTSCRPRLYCLTENLATNERLLLWSDEMEGWGEWIHSIK